MSSINNENGLKIVWFPFNQHSEVSFKNEVYYFIGKFNRYLLNPRKLSTAVSKSDDTPIVIVTVPTIFYKKINKIEEQIQINPPSKWNTCMGTVSEIVNSYSNIKIPLLIRQSPELSALYLIGRSEIYKDITVEYHGISKSQAINKAALGSCVQILVIGVISVFIANFFRNIEV